MDLLQYLKSFRVGIEIEYRNIHENYQGLKRYITKKLGKPYDSYEENYRVAEISTQPIMLLEKNKNNNLKLLDLFRIASKGIYYGSIDKEHPCYFTGELTLAGSMHTHISGLFMQIDNYIAPSLLLLTMPLMSRTGYNFRNVRIIRIRRLIPLDDKISWLNLRDGLNTLEFRLNEYIPLIALLIPALMYTLNSLRAQGYDITPTFKNLYIDLLEGRKQVIYPSVYLFKYRKFAKANSLFKQLVLEVVDRTLDMLIGAIKKETANDVDKLIAILELLKNNLEDWYFPADYFQIVRQINFKRYKGDLDILANRICKYTKTGIASKLRKQLANIISE